MDNISDGTIDLINTVNNGESSHATAFGQRANRRTPSATGVLIPSKNDALLTCASNMMEELCSKSEALTTQSDASVQSRVRAEVKTALVETNKSITEIRALLESLSAKQLSS